MSVSGLDFLAPVPVLMIRQRTQLLEACFPACERQNEYKIAAVQNAGEAPDDSVFQSLPTLLYAQEESTCACRFFCGRNREFKLHMNGFVPFWNFLVVSLSLSLSPLLIISSCLQRWTGRPDLYVSSSRTPVQVQHLPALLSDQSARADDHKRHKRHDRPCRARLSMHARQLFPWLDFLRPR